MGATGDGGAFERFADVLASDFTVVTYDRRGNGRSPRPTGWDMTTPEEQADDAAALLNALGLAPAAVFGTSSRGIFALAKAFPVGVSCDEADEPLERRRTSARVHSLPDERGNPSTHVRRVVE